jgi:membrane protein implicated in regulation of membrane protease activity
MDLWVLWLVIIFVLIIAEASTINLVSIWFIASGIISLIVSFFIDSFLVQFTIFVILGLILLITTRKFLNSWLKPKSERTNLDRVIGASALVTEPISKNKVGEVKVLGKYWSAISESRHALGEEVIVDAIDGVKLIVRKKEE